MSTKTMAAIALGASLAVTLTACGSSSTNTNTNSASTGSSSQNGTGTRAGGRFGGGIPGTSGLVAALTGSTAQVQSTSAQTAVTWTSSTTFTNEVKVTKSAIKVGECVQASRAFTTTGSSGATTSGPLAAATVRITSTAGGCTNIRTGNRTAPSGAPTNVPGGQNGTRPRNFGNFAAIGVVTSVSSSGFVVKPTSFAGSSTTPVTVTTSSTTTYTETEKATASSVKVGICLSANGTTSSTGAVTATRITLSQPTNGVCTQARFGGGGFPGGGGGGFGGGFQGGGGAPQNG